MEVAPPDHTRHGGGWGWVLATAWHAGQGEGHVRIGCSTTAAHMHAQDDVQGDRGLVPVHRETNVCALACLRKSACGLQGFLPSGSSQPLVSTPLPGNAVTTCGVHCYAPLPPPVASEWASTRRGSAQQAPHAWLRQGMGPAGGPGRQAGGRAPMQGWLGRRAGHRAPPRPAPPRAGDESRPAGRDGCPLRSAATLPTPNPEDRQAHRQANQHHRRHRRRDDYYYSKGAVAPPFARLRCSPSVASRALPPKQRLGMAGGCAGRRAGPRARRC